jgi:hypothetical protein
MTSARVGSSPVISGMHDRLCGIFAPEARKCDCGSSARNPVWRVLRRELPGDAAGEAELHAREECPHLQVEGT